MVRGCGDGVSGGAWTRWQRQPANRKAVRTCRLVCIVANALLLNAKEEERRVVREQTLRDRTDRMRWGLEHDTQCAAPAKEFDRAGPVQVAPHALHAAETLFST